MLICAGNRFRFLCLIAVLLVASFSAAVSGAAWNGVLRDGSGKALAGAVVRLHSASGGRDYSATTAANGTFAFADIAAGTYEASVKVADKEWKGAASLVVKDASTLTMSLQISSPGP